LLYIIFIKSETYEIWFDKIASLTITLRAHDDDDNKSSHKAGIVLHESLTFEYRRKITLKELDEH